MVARSDMAIDIREAAALAAAFQRAPEVVEAEIHAATLESLLLLEREVKENTPVGIGGGGGLKGSFSARGPNTLGEETLGEVGSNLNYAVPVELGSKPHFPPIEPLSDWARAKLGVPAEEARSVGFLVARKISRKGTEPVEMVQRAMRDNERQVQEIFSRAVARIASRIGGQA
ncbi:MAG: hypothetical protein ACLFWF_07960 [Alphaproteobacteria bacterium]